MQMLDHALALAAQGFWVFPLRVNGKTPLSTGWQDQATRDPPRQGEGPGDEGQRGEAQDEEEGVAAQALAEAAGAPSWAGGAGTSGRSAGAGLWSARRPLAGSVAHSTVMLTAVEPPVGIEASGCEPCEGRWRVFFRVVNVGAAAVSVSDAWLPHGRFRGDGHIPLDLRLPPGETTSLALRVTAREDPGTIVENAFLILRLGDRRVFARLRVRFDADGAPRPVVESVTAQSLE